MPKHYKLFILVCLIAVSLSPASEVHAKQAETTEAKGWSAIAVGSIHSLGVKSDGSVWQLCFRFVLLRRRSEVLSNGTPQQKTLPSTFKRSSKERGFMMKLRVMTFNLRVDVPADGQNGWPHRKEHVAETILGSTPDIISTQEGRYGMLEELDGLLPHYKRVGEGRAGFRSGDETSDECCAIYYDVRQLSLLETGQFWLSETPDQPSGPAWDADYTRFCTWSLMKSVQDPDIKFFMFNTHFDHVGESARARSAELILDKMLEISKDYSAPVILTGDLNCYPNDNAIATLSTSLSNAYDELARKPGLTFHDFEGGLDGKPIDYIFVSRDITVGETNVIRAAKDGRYPSDHYPVVALLTL